MKPIGWLAECRTCGKTWQSANAVPAAVRHSKASGHEVTAEVTIYGRGLAGKASGHEVTAEVTIYGRWLAGKAGGVR